MTEGLGSLSLDKRLERIEVLQDKILTKMDSLANVEDVRELRRRVETLERDGSKAAQEALIKENALDARIDVLERSTISKSALKWFVVPYLTATGLALGLVYEIVSKH